MKQQGGQLPVFHGGHFQRGYGIGSFFSSLARRALPLFQKGMKTVGKAALKTGMNIAGDVLAGNSLRDSTRSRIRQTAQTLKDQALSHLSSQMGSGTKRIKRKKPQNKISSPQASKAKGPNKALPKRKQTATHYGQVKKSKVTHLKKDIFD